MKRKCLFVMIAAVFALAGCGSAASKESSIVSSETGSAVESSQLPVESSESKTPEASLSDADEEEEKDLVSEQRRETVEKVLSVVFTAPNPELTPEVTYIGLDEEAGDETEEASDSLANWEEAVGDCFMEGRLEKFLNNSSCIGIQISASEGNKTFSYAGMEITEETDLHISCTVLYTIDGEEYQTSAMAWFDNDTDTVMKELELGEIS